MKTIYKGIMIACIFTMFAFSQIADTIKPHGTVLDTTTQSINLPVDVKPKAPTNWSKIKDLFL